MTLIVFNSCSKSDPAPNYTNFKITAITINEFPEFNNGSIWDALATSSYSYPDIFFTLSNGVDQVNGDVINDVKQSQTSILSWNFTSAFQITNTATVHYLYIGDYDYSTTTSGSDEISSFSFVMDNYKSGYPTSINLTDGYTSVTITGSWY